MTKAKKDMSLPVLAELCMRIDNSIITAHMLMS